MFSSIYKRIEKRALALWGSLLVLLIAAEVVATVYIPLARELLYTGIQVKSHNKFIDGLLVLSFVVGIYCICQGFKYYTGHRVGLVIRTAIVHVLKDAWAAKLKTKFDYDNPDQRIQEDSLLVTESALSVAIETLISIAIVVGLLHQMWGSWILLGSAMVYTAISTCLVLFFHRPLISADKNLQRGEAGFRFELAKISIKKLDKSINPTYNVVVDRYLRYTKVLMGFTLFSAFKNNLMGIVPYLILVPLFFVGHLTFGELMKGVSQFELLAINTTIFIVVYPQITKVIASYERIAEFYKGLNEVREPNQGPAT